MAILVSAATGNLTAAATWKVVHAGTFQTLRATQETASQNVTTTVTGSTNFTVAANTTVDAVLLKHQNTIVTASADLSVSIYNATTATTVATMTMNQANLPLVTATPNWFQFEFSSSVTLTTGNNYQIRLVATGSNQSSFFRRSATAGDWTFGLRTTTTQAPASGDILIIAGKYTASTSANYVVTNNNTNTALLLGNGVAGTCGIEVNYGSSLENQRTASTNYSLRVSGDFAFNGGSLFKCGTPTNTFPQSSTATFEIDQPANQRFSLLIRSTVNAFTEFVAYEDQTGKRLQRSFLGAAIAATNTSITVENSGTTNWKNGDEIVVGSTERNYQQVEYRTMSANESAGTVTVSSGFTNAHSRYHDSWSKIKVPVANLTKNIIFKGTSTTLRAGNMTFGAFTNVILSGVLFQNWGQLGFDQSQGTDYNGVTGIVPFTQVFDVVIKDYTTGVRTVTRNPKDLNIERLTAARALAISTWALQILNITESATIENGFNLNLGNIYSFGGTGTIDGRIQFNPSTTNSSNFWNVTSSGTDLPGIDMYINGLNGNSSTNVYPFNIDGGTAFRREGLEWTVDLGVRVIACQGWASLAACVIEGYQPPNYWSSISAIKNDGNGIYWSSVSDRSIVHNDGTNTDYFSIAEQNGLAQIATTSTANVFPALMQDIFVGATVTNPGTAFFSVRYVQSYSFIVRDVIGATLPTSGIFIFSGDANALGGATKQYFDFSLVTSSTLTATNTLFVGNSGTQFTSESAFTYKDNSGNMYTYTRDAVMYPDSVNYYLNGPSTVFDTTGQTPKPAFTTYSMQTYELICVPMKKFVVPANKSAKVSVWIYVTGTPSMTAALVPYDLGSGFVISGTTTTTTKNAWTKLTVSVPTSTSDRFIGARLSVSTPDIIVKISDWNVEFV